MSMILPHRHDQMTLPQVVGFIATAQKLQGLQRRQRRPAVALGQDVDAPPGVNGTGTFPWIRREVFGQVKPTWEPLKNCRNDQNTRDSYSFWCRNIYGDLSDLIWFDGIWMKLGNHWSYRKAGLLPRNIGTANCPLNLCWEPGEFHGMDVSCW